MNSKMNKLEINIKESSFQPSKTPEVSQREKDQVQYHCSPSLHPLGKEWHLYPLEVILLSESISLHLYLYYGNKYFKIH